MNLLAPVVRREFRVAFSRHAQPVWFRIIKWTVILTAAAMFYDRAAFWWSLAGWAVLGTVVHFIYRAKTIGWTRPWGGWKDLAAGRD